MPFIIQHFYHLVIPCPPCKKDYVFTSSVYIQQFKLIGEMSAINHLLFAGMQTFKSLE